MGILGAENAAEFRMPRCIVVADEGPRISHLAPGAGSPRVRRPVQGHSASIDAEPPLQLLCSHRTFLEIRIDRCENSPI